MKIAIGQINPIIGDITYNTAKIIENIRKAKLEKADLIVFPELCISGYPPKDLLLRKDFLTAVEEAIKIVLTETNGIGVIIGAPYESENGLTNACFLLENQEIVLRQDKTLLPNYDVFDESRYFIPASSNNTVSFRGINLGLTICEDIWNDKDFWNRKRYQLDPVEELVKKGAKLIINISASPYNIDKQGLREEMLTRIADKHGVDIVYVNQIGGNDDLIFDGSSFIALHDRGVIKRCGSFCEEFAVVEMNTSYPTLEKPLEGIAAIHDALVLGVSDYLHKTGFKKALIGLSGGIDSAVTAALAVAALGQENVFGIAMPSRYSSQGSIGDAQELANNLNISFEIIHIDDIFKAFLAKLNYGEEIFQDLAEENIQARIRGNLLMFKSNREGALLLSTGNKSEMAVGYTTLYGDMCGGLAVISDIPKTTVYQLAQYINRDKIYIPESTITKPPSAELRPNQVDQDSLPPYEILDGILKAYIEDNQTLQEIVALGFDEELTKKVLNQVDRNEYKRRQAPPGLKVTTKAFGVGRRMPIAEGWRV